MTSSAAVPAGQTVYSVEIVFQDRQHLGSFPRTILGCSSPEEACRRALDWAAEGGHRAAVVSARVRRPIQRW